MYQFARKTVNTAMYKECKTEKSLQRRIKIEECLIAEMWKKDYEQIHISDICREVGITRAVFYRYFDTKADVLDAWLDRRVSSYSDARWHTTVTEDPLTESTRNFIRYWYENRDVPELLIRQNMFDLLVQKEIGASAHMPHVNQILGMEDNSTDIHRTLIFSAYGIMGILRDWQMRGFMESEDDVVEVIKTLLLKPLYLPEKLMDV